jgi:hypothetical protein
MNSYPQEFDRAVFTVSIDFELMWGTADRPYAHAFRGLCETERAEVVERLLGLLTQYQISATWGIVGHLFLEERERSVTRLQRPLQPARLYHAADLVRRVQTCATEQEIGSHTFSHIEMDDCGCSKTKAELEVNECVRQAARWGIEMKSFIFPRNRVGHLDVLKEHGFSCYRGPEPQWYVRKRRAIRRLGHFLDIATMRTPPSVMPVEENGIWNIPGSMLYTPSFGTRKFVPVWMRVRRAKRGLDLAVRKKQVFHLWFHPTDLACRADAMLDGLERIFRHAAELRDAGKLRVKTMRDLVPATEAAAERRREAHFVA